MSFARCHRCVWCMVLLLSVGLIAGLTWAQLVYIGHMDDACDQPLAAMLRTGPLAPFREDDCEIDSLHLYDQIMTILINDDQL